MGLTAHLWLEDNAGQTIKGGSTVTNRKDSIEIFKIDYNVSRGYDSQTGKIHGLREHAPFCIIKPLDAASPYLFEYCTTGKNISKATLKMYKINEQGIESAYYSYVLHNAKVISTYPLVSSLSDEVDMEGVNFAFESITATYLDGNISHTDSWNKRARS